MVHKEGQSINTPKHHNPILANNPKWTEGTCNTYLIICQNAVISTLSTIVDISLFPLNISS